MDRVAGYAADLALAALGVGAGPCPNLAAPPQDVQSRDTETERPPSSLAMRSEGGRPVVYADPLTLARVDGSVLAVTACTPRRSPG